MRFPLVMLELLVAVAFWPGCGGSDPPVPPRAPGAPGSGTLRINVDNLALRAPFTEIDLHITRAELFYGTVSPPGEDGGDCNFAGQTAVAGGPIAIAVDLTHIGDSFVGEFSAPPGFISEIRLVSDSTRGIEQGLSRRAHPSTRCSGDDTSGLFRLVPLPGQTIAVVAGDTTQVEVQFDPTRDITVDGQGGGYGQGGNHPPGNGCDPSGPCGKPFKLASDYGVIAFVASAAKSWRASMSNTPLPGTGCFKAVYPSAVWQQVQCVKAPQVPYGPAPQPVGNGNDFAAQSAGLISMAVGSFDSATGVTSIQSSAGAIGPYTLQINARPFQSPACNGGANCLGWQQFVLDGNGVAFMQYWLLNFGSCPIGWLPFMGSCYRNSFAIGVPFQTPANLTQMSLIGKATSTMDTVMYSTTGGEVSAVGADSVLDLQAGWDTAEFNIFGDANGTQANINAGLTIVVRTSITDGTMNAPICLGAGFTGETNSLDLVLPCCTVSGAETAIVFTESNVAGATSICPAACVPTTCAKLGFNCGTAPDDCGGMLNCGGCGGILTCGGGGTPNVCGSPFCHHVPVSWNSSNPGFGEGPGCGVPNSGQCNTHFCWPVQDFCDFGVPTQATNFNVNGLCNGFFMASAQPTNIVYSPTESIAWFDKEQDACYSSGCQGALDITYDLLCCQCTPTTCAAQGKNCGTISDGCGGTLSCGSCAGIDTCGGGGTANVCGNPGCMPTTCAAQGKNCGTIPDGCGGVLACGTCMGGQLCGGAGTPNVCGCHGVNVAWNSGNPGFGQPPGCGIANTSNECTTPFCWGVTGTCDSGTPAGIIPGSLSIGGNCNGFAMSSAAPTDQFQSSTNSADWILIFDKEQVDCYTSGCASALSMTFDLTCCP